MRYANRTMDPEAALRDLKDSNPRVRLQAADALGHVGEEYANRACQALRPLLHDDRSDIRYSVALSLGELKDKEAIDSLIQQMQGDGHPMARQGAVIALGLIADPRAAPCLIEAISKGPADVRFQAIASLAQIDPGAAQQPLRKALQDEDPEVRASAAATLSDIKDMNAREAIFALLEDFSPTVQIEAAMALARLGDRRGTPVLIEHLEDKAYQHQAAEHLFHCPDRAAIPALRQTLNRWLAPPVIKVWAAGALWRLQEEEGRRQLLALLGSRRQMVRGLCIQVLGEISEPWARQALQYLAASRAGESWQEEISEALHPKGKIA